MPQEVHTSRPVVQRSLADPLGYDTRDPAYPAKLAADAMSGRHEAEIQDEVQLALKRWGMRK